MLNIGFSEILLVLVVICLVTDPKKIPKLLKSFGVYYKKFREAKEEILGYVNTVCDGDFASLKKPKKAEKPNMKHIVGNDGAVYEAYDVSEIITKRNTISPKKKQNQSTKVTTEKSGTKGK